MTGQAISWIGKKGSTQLSAPAIFGLSLSQHPFYRPAGEPLASFEALVEVHRSIGIEIADVIAQWKTTEVNKTCNAYLDRRVQEGREDLVQTAMYVRKCARIFAIFNDHVPIKSIEDPRLEELRAIVQWFQEWVESVEARIELSPSIRDTMRIHDRTVFDLVLAFRGFIGFLTDFKAEFPNGFLIPHLFSQDGLENWFGQVRGVGSQHNAPNCNEYGARVNQVTAAGFSRQVKKGNTAGTSKAGLNYALSLQRHYGRGDGHHASLKFSGP